MSAPDFSVADDARAFEEAACGLAVLDGDGLILRANQAMLVLAGCDADAAVGRLQLVDLLAVAGKMFYFTHVDPLLRMQGFVNEISAEMKGGDGARTPVYLNFRFAPAAGDRGRERIHVSVFRGRDRAAYEEELRLARQQAEHLSAIVVSSQDAMFSVDRTGRVLTANPGVETLFGIAAADALGRDLAQVLGRDSESSELSAKVAAALGGEHASLSITCALSDQTRELTLSLSPIRDDAGEVAAVSVVCRDVTEQARANEHVNLLMNEVNHRSKNLLAVVQGVARQTARSAASVDEFMDRFAARLSAIAASHDLLVSGAWRGTRLDDLVRVQLAHLGELIENRLTLLGPPLVVSPKAAEALGLALHELSTNAVKHGALSVEGGSVAIAWSAAEGVFAFEWAERGGPAVQAPAEQGFGSIVLGRMAPQAVGGVGVLSYDPGGVRYLLSTRLHNILG